MDHSLKLNDKDYYFFSFSASIVIHIIILIVCFMLLRKGEESYPGKGILVQIVQEENSISNTDELISHKTNNLKSEKVSLNKTTSLTTPNLKGHSMSGYNNFEGTGTDTSGLEQLYA